MQAPAFTVSLEELLPAAAAWPALLTFVVGAAILLTLIQLGRWLAQGLGLQRWGSPEALLAGGLGLLLAPNGPLPLIPEPVIQLWSGLPLVLLTLVFATLLLAKPLPAISGLWRPLSAQILLALTLAFGQYLVAGLVVLLWLQPLLGSSPVMACLIEVAYEGGHGSAAALGASYTRLGFPGGESLGLALSTVGLLASTLVGGLLVVIGRRRGWCLTPAIPDPALQAPEPGPIKATGASSQDARGHDTAGSSSPSAGPPPSMAQRFRDWARNLGLIGGVVLLGWSALMLLQRIAAHGRATAAAVVEALPVFPLALLASLLMRWLLERGGRQAWVSAPIQRQVGTISADLLITAATACLDLHELAREWLPLTALAVAGLAWNLAVVLLLAPRILPANWFERGLVEFGQATGVAASGLLLLAMVDPEDRNGTLTPFSIKQMLLQPLLAGGVITVVAPLTVQAWGLPLWTTICGLLVLLWIGLGLRLAAGSEV
ncbi:MAG: sodium/glutamate symporter [Cyanobacteriota bacterium]